MVKKKKKSNNTYSFIPTQCQSVFLHCINLKGNLLVFPVAVQLAFGLDTVLCSDHRGHVHCLGAWRKTDRQTDRKTDMLHTTFKINQMC